MPSFTTIYRAIVLLVVGAIVVKGWRLYGPSAEQVKSAVVSAIDMAQTALKNQQADDQSHAPANAIGAAPLFGNTTQAGAANALAPPPAALTPPVAGQLSLDNGSNAPAPARSGPSTPSADKAAAIASSERDRLAPLFSRLEQLGAADPKLAPWGSSGHLYRFCCRAALADSPAYTQHFESVAAEPAAAVEQVVAQVEAWRTSRRNDTTLR